jgi:hypothetical protein
MYRRVQRSRTRARPSDLACWKEKRKKKDEFQTLGNCDQRAKATDDRGMITPLSVVSFWVCICSPPPSRTDPDSWNRDPTNRQVICVAGAAAEGLPGNPQPGPPERTRMGRRPSHASLIQDGEQSSIRLLSSRTVRSPSSVLNQLNEIDMCREDKNAWPPDLSNTTQHLLSHFEFLRCVPAP